MMSDWTHSSVDEIIDRFARGDLSRAEARDLAQASLESAALFDELTATAMAKAAAAALNSRAYVEPARKAWWRSPVMLVAASSFASLVIVSVLIAKFSVTNKGSIAPAGPRIEATAPVLKPTLDFSDGSSQPILLADDLQQFAREQPAQVFRGQEQSTRAPRQTGSVVLIEGGLATFNLGSIDGVAKGSEVEVFTDQTFRQRVGRLSVATIFREQARAPLLSMSIQPHYAVKISDSTHLTALLQQVDDLAAQGQATHAREIAEQSAHWAQSANLTPGEKALSLERVAQLDFQAGAIDEAEARYRAALDLLNTGRKISSGVKISIQNDLASVAILRGDYDLAGKLLDQENTSSDQKSEASRLNNLGVLAELHGNKQQAESLYAQALQSLGQVQDALQEQKLVEANLTRIKGMH
jgi:tetratricopeptide (TPR) repeat protein